MLKTPGPSPENRKSRGTWMSEDTKQEFTEAIRSMLNSNAEIMTRQTQLGETVREDTSAVTGEPKPATPRKRQRHPQGPHTKPDRGSV